MKRIMCSLGEIDVDSSSTLMKICKYLRRACERAADEHYLALSTNPSWRISASELTDHLLPWVVGVPRSAKEHRPFSPTIRAYIFALPRCK